MEGFVHCLLFISSPPVPLLNGLSSQCGGIITRARICGALGKAARGDKRAACRNPTTYSTRLNEAQFRSISLCNTVRQLVVPG